MRTLSPLFEYLPRLFFLLLLGLTQSGSRGLYRFFRRIALSGRFGLRLGGGGSGRLGGGGSGRLGSGRFGFLLFLFAISPPRADPESSGVR